MRIARLVNRRTALIFVILVALMITGAFLGRTTLSRGRLNKNPIVGEGNQTHVAKASGSHPVAVTVCSTATTVLNANDSGSGSLRDAIANLCDGGTIDFDSGLNGQTIGLTSGELVIDKSLTIQGSTSGAVTISGNATSRVFNVNAGMNFTFSNLTISAGQATSGGGVYNLGNLTILNSTLTENTATVGGAIDTESGVVKIINSTISANTASNGGGLYNGGTSQTTITNSTITGNNEGIRDVGSNPLRLNNTIVARNPNCAFCDEVDVFVDNTEVPNATIDPASSNNLIGVNGGVIGISNGVNGNQIGSAEAPIDPLLGPLANNGGPTFTHALNNFSPAIDAGNNALALDQSNAALTTDQRGTGFARIENSVVDIGAYEKTFGEQPPTADVSVSKAAGSEESLADRDIVYTITVTNAGPDAAANATMVDTLPGDLTFVSMPTPAGWSCTTPSVGSGGTVNCENSNLANGSVVVFTLTVHIPASPGQTLYHNVATVSTASNDSNSANDSASANVTLVSCLTNPVVISDADSGGGSLRQAIIGACDGSTIAFDMNQVVSPITLTSGELLINKNLTFSGPGANLLTISGNNASRIFNIQAGKTMGISGLTIANGKTLGDGGGILNQGTLTLSNCAITNNSSPNSGGGISNDNTMVIIGSTISGNSGSTAGGGIASGGTLTLINSTISGNTGDGLSNSGIANLTNDTFSANTIRGITNNGSATANVRNTIVANTPGSAGDVDGAFNSQGNNLIGKRDGSTGFTNGVNADKVGAIASPLNALLAALGNYGGPTQTHALLPGSPAIDGANNCVTDVAHCGDANIPQLENDQRGLERQVGSAVDIGAFESRGFTISATSGTPQSAVINTTFAAPLIATVSSDFGEPVGGGQATFTAPASGPSSTFTGGVLTINSAINPSGQASASATANGIVGGPYEVTASGTGITGTANFSLTNTKVNQTINFGALANKTFGDPDFVVNATASSGLPVSFAASGNCTVTSPSPGTVHITGAGSCTITASQAGDANYNPATNVPQAFTIAKAATNTSVTSNPNPSVLNQNVTFVATVTSVAVKTGLVQFKDNGSNLGAPVALNASGVAQLTTSSLAFGPHTITADYSGDANFLPSTGTLPGGQLVRATTNTAVSSSSNPSDFGQNVTFTATVTSVALKTGTVQFKDNGVNLGAPVALNASGGAQFSTSLLTVGTHTITAEYSGDANILASTGTLPGGQVVKPQPSLSINDVSIVEGNPGTKVLAFTITLSAASSLPLSVSYATANGTAMAGSDYVATSGSFTFNPSANDVTRTVNVTINGDFTFEGDETFTVTLSNPLNATISKAVGTGTILNDDALGGFISFTQSNYDVNENAGVVTLTVTRSFASVGQAQMADVLEAANVDYATDDTGASTNCAALNTGLASQRCDYTSVFGTLKFAVNETQKTIDIPINLDGYTEGPEVFTVKLSNPTGGAVAVPATATVTISDWSTPPPNSIDDTMDFVRQQYRDFLNRDADAAGLAFWKDNIDKCNDPARRPANQTVAQCIEVQRITTSAAFFLSIEFKQTGGLVREFYVAALDRPLTNNMPSFVEFMRDTQAIQKGVVVGQGNWQQLLDANRTAFMNDFVTRTEFVALYPTTDTPAQYVDKLYLHANVTPSLPERLNVIGEFGGAGTAADPRARGRALLRITQNAVFQAREANRTFVQIEYFGYLRRDPDLAGYNFWVNKLNQFNGDFLQAEMVKGFLTSSEYRARFGP